MMRQFLTLVIALHWMAAFALLAGFATVDAETGTRLVLTTLGGAAGLPADLLGSTGLALAFALVASLFLWAFVTAAFDTAMTDEATEEITGLAVISASVVVVLLALTSIIGTTNAFFPALAAVLAALLASRMALTFERRKAAAPNDEDIRAALRMMAAGAANRAMLSRLSGRPAPVTMGAA